MKDSQQVKDMTEELRSARLDSVFAGKFWKINELKLGLSEMKEAAERRRKLDVMNARLGRKLAEEHIYM